MTPHPPRNSDLNILQRSTPLPSTPLPPLLLSSLENPYNEHQTATAANEEGTSNSAIGDDNHMQNANIMITGITADTMENSTAIAGKNPIHSNPISSDSSTTPSTKVIQSHSSAKEMDLVNASHVQKLYINNAHQANGNDEGVMIHPPPKTTEKEEVALSTAQNNTNSNKNNTNISTNNTTSSTTTTVAKAEGSPPHPPYSTGMDWGGGGGEIYGNSGMANNGMYSGGSSGMYGLGMNMGMGLGLGTGGGMYGGYGGGMGGMNPLMGMGMGLGVNGPLSSLNQFLFGVQTVIFSLGQAIQIMSMNASAIQQLLDSAMAMFDHAVATYHEMQTLEQQHQRYHEGKDQQQQRSLEDTKRHRRLKALRWALLTACSYAGYRLIRRLVTGLMNRPTAIYSTEYRPSLPQSMMHHPQQQPLPPQYASSPYPTSSTGRLGGPPVYPGGTYY